MPSGPFSPRDVIHSVNASPSTPSSSSSSKPRRLSIFSPRSSLASGPSLRRLLGMRRTNVSREERNRQNVTGEVTDSEDSASEGDCERTNGEERRRRQLWWMKCACFMSGGNAFGRNRVDEDDEFTQHLKTMKPTYVPKSPLLPPGSGDDDRICLVLDLDETLVHSSFTRIDGADFEIELEMQGEIHTVFVKKRPGVDEFLKRVSEWYEVVIFTASLAIYANPVVDLLDPGKLVGLRLYREHCVLVGGCYVKDIGKLGRDLKRTLIVDNSPLSYVLQPENAIPIQAFFTDDNDKELDRTLQVLEAARHLRDVRKGLR